MDQLLFLFLSNNGILNIDKKDLHFQLLTHPDQSSIKSITDTLDYFGIENVAAQVPKEALTQLPQAFLAVVNGSDGTELVLVSQKGQKVSITDLSNKKLTIDSGTFLEQWTGTIIAADKNETPAIPIKTKYYDHLTIGLVLLLFLFTTLFNLDHQWYSLVYTVLSLLGLILSYLIIKEQFGIKDTITARVCGALSSNPQGCSTVINSKQSKLFKDFGLGDLSLMYFMSITLGLTMFGIDYSFIYVLSVLTLPIVAYTLTVQRWKLKSWCILCLLISTILLSQFTVLQITKVNWDFSFSYILRSGFLVTILTISWISIKNLINQKQSLIKVKSDFYKFKRNPGFFFHALESGEKRQLNKLSSSAEVIFGDPDAKVQLTGISNPLCGYCAESFEVYHKLLSNNIQNVGVQFVFNTPNDNENISTRIAHRVLEIYHIDQKEALEALNNWFTHKNVDEWFGIYGQPNVNDTNTLQILEKQRD